MDKDDKDKEKDNDNIWLDNFKRQAGIRSGIILHGDIFDICHVGKTYVPVIDAIIHTLEERKFDHIVVWDRFSGIENIADDKLKDLLEKSVSRIDSSNEDGGVDYSYSVPSSPRKQQESNYKDPGEFLPVVYHHMVHPGKKRIAFILDWSQYLFGNANVLSEQDRQWLLIIAKAMRNAPLLIDDSLEDLAKPTNIIILLCQKLGSIPPSLYQSNPSIQEIVVSPPGRRERETFLKDNRSRFKFPVPLGEVDFNDFVDSLEGMSLRDLQQLIRLSRQVPEEHEKSLTYERLINLYRYGEQKSPWEDLSREKLRTIHETLKKRVKGQDEAIDKVAKVIIRAFTGLSGLQHSKKQRMPKGTLFFVGPTGVGKTELAKALAQFLFGDEEACIRFDMSEFREAHSDQRLVGAPPGYVGYEEGGQLTNAVKKRPFSVLLFDEIDKADVRILDKFLQILEDGRLTDGKGETVYFSETIIIFTSNLGAPSAEIKEKPEENHAQFINAVRKFFVSEPVNRPELLNRIGDNIVPFNFIRGNNFLVSIAKTKLEPLRERLREKYKIKDLVFKDEERALTALAECVDPQMGGRGVLNEIVTRIIDPLAERLFKEEEDPRYYYGKTIQILQEGDKAEFKFKITQE